MSFIHHLTLGYFDPDAVRQRGRVVVATPVLPAQVRDLEAACREGFGLKEDLARHLTAQGVIRFPYLGPLSVNQQLYERGYLIGYLAHRLFGMRGADVGCREVLFPESRAPVPGREEMFAWLRQHLPREDEASLRQRADRSYESMVERKRFRAQARRSVESYLRTRGPA